MNRREVLQDCLRRMSAQTLAGYEVIVVDNASTDGTGEMVQTLFPAAKYVRLSQNMGPGGGRNCGVRLAAADLCVFLDDDACFVALDALARIHARFSADRMLGILALRILCPLDGKEEYKSIPRIDKRRIDKDYPCTYFCGAGFACRRELFMASGMFWSDLFLYSEELDLSYRALDKGAQIIRSYDIAVLHMETPQARVPGQRIYFGARNRLWVALRNLPIPYVVAHAMLWWAYLLVMASRHGHLTIYFRGLIDAIAGIPCVLRMRKCISNRTLRQLKALSGRLYY